MDVRKLLNIRLDRLIAGIMIAVSVLLNSCSMFSTIPSFTPLLSLSVWACIVFLIPSAPIRSSRLYLAVAAVCFWIFLSSVFSFSAVNISICINLSALIALSYLISTRISFERFAMVFLESIAIISAASIALWLLVDVAGFVPPLPRLKNVNGVHYRTIGLASYIDEPYLSERASLGVFWEQGVFASFLIIALYLELHFKESPRLSRVVLFTAALFTTGSTAGYILLPFVFLSKMLGSKDKRFRLLATISAVALIIILVFWSDSISQYLARVNPEMFSKLIDNAAVTKSTRFYSPLLCLSIFNDSPILGLGYAGANDAYIALAGSTEMVDSLTSTSAFLMAAFGLCGLLMALLPLAAIMRLHHLSVPQRLLACVLFLLVLNKEPHTTDLFMMILVMYACQEAFSKIKNLSCS